MYLVAIAWMYVVLMMSLAEAFSPHGGLLGASITFVLYGVVPLSIVMYLLGTPHRRAARRRAEMAEAAQVTPAAQVPEAAPTAQTAGTAPTAAPVSREAALAEAASDQATSAQADHGGHAPAASAVDALVPERKEP